MKLRNSEYPLCRHTKTDALLCQSPAPVPLVTSTRKPHRTRISRATPALTGHLLYPLRGARSIQQALSMVLAGLVSIRIRPAQAGKMLFALKTATPLHKAPVE